MEKFCGGRGDAASADGDDISDDDDDDDSSDHNDDGTESDSDTDDTGSERYEDCCGRVQERSAPGQHVCRSNCLHRYTSLLQRPARDRPQLLSVVTISLLQSLSNTHTYCSGSIFSRTWHLPSLFVYHTILRFTVLHVMQTRYSDENSVCPSVCPSVTRMIPDKTEERSVQIPYERTFILVF